MLQAMRILKYVSLLILFCFFTDKISFAESYEEHAGFLFIENQGQWDEKIHYRAEIPGGHLYVHDEGISLVFYDPDDMQKMHDHREETFDIDGQAIMYDFEGIRDDNSEIIPSDPVNTLFNFYTSNDPEKHASGLQGFQQLTITEVNEGVDLILYSKNNRLKYDLYVHPGHSVDEVEYSIKGADSLYIQDDKLQIDAGFASFSEGPPLLFEGTRIIEENKISGRYYLEGNKVGYRLEEKREYKGDILVDPEFVFSTYSGSRGDNFGYTATYDEAGNGYAGGTVFAPGFPVTSGAFQIEYNGDEDGNSRNAGILKFTPDGSDLEYATYLGGGDGNEHPHSIVVNSENQLVVFGNTTSEDFPVSGNAWEQSHSGFSDIFVSVLSEDGTSLEGSTFIGGTGWDGRNGRNPDDIYEVMPVGYNYGDAFRGEVIVDEDDNIFIATSSRSDDFPVSGAGFNNSWPGGDQNAVVISFSPDVQSLRWAGFLGASGDEGAFGITQHSNGDFYVTGGTTSEDFPVTDGTLNDEYPGGDASGFAVRIAGDGSAIEAGTFLGTDEFDLAFLSSEGAEKHIYFAGQTTGEYDMTINKYGTANSGQFIDKLTSDLQNRIWATTIGTGEGRPDISPSAFLVDQCGRIYYTGWGGETNQGSVGRGGDLHNLPVTDDAIQSTTNGSGFYVAVFSPEMEDLLYATYLGSELSNDHVDGGTSRFDERGNVYQSVCAGCNGGSDFPTTANAWSRENLGERVLSNQTGCNNLLFKINFDFETDFNYEKDICARTVYFEAPGGNVFGHYWDFGDGNSSEEDAPAHTFANNDIYEVMLIVNPGTPCADTVTKEIDLTNSTSPDDLEVPNVFTPDGDGYNDTFFIKNLDKLICYDYEFLLFNRWGNKLLHKKEDYFEWDGKIDGEKLEPGTYYYILRFAEAEDESGTINLIR